MVTPTYDFLVEAEAKRSFAGSFFAYFFSKKVGYFTDSPAAFFALISLMASR